MATQAIDPRFAAPSDSIRDAAADLIRAKTTDSEHGLSSASKALDVPAHALLSISIGDEVEAEIYLTRVAIALSR